MKQYNAIDPEFVELLHVDDFISGTETKEEAKVLFEKSKTHLVERGLNLRKFKSNSIELEEYIFNKFQADSVVFSKCYRIIRFEMGKRFLHFNF